LKGDSQAPGWLKDGDRSANFLAGGAEKKKVEKSADACAHAASELRRLAARLRKTIGGMASKEEKQMGAGAIGPPT
jgi:hypothetical protein